MKILLLCLFLVSCGGAFISRDRLESIIELCDYKEVYFDDWRGVEDDTLYCKNGLKIVRKNYKREVK